MAPKSLKRALSKLLYDAFVKVFRDAASNPNVKVKATEFFKQMEDVDESALVSRHMRRGLSIKKYVEEYDRLNISFD